MANLNRNNRRVMNEFKFKTQSKWNRFIRRDASFYMGTSIYFKLLFLQGKIGAIKRIKGKILHNDHKRYKLSRNAILKCFEILSCIAYIVDVYVYQRRREVLNGTKF